MAKNTALKKSIKKWKRIKNGTGADKWSDNCALCKEYADCCGCPVKLDTGFGQCIGTPWTGWIMHHSVAHGNDSSNLKVQCDECKELAQAELDYLKGLHDG